MGDNKWFIVGKAPGVVYGEVQIQSRKGDRSYSGVLMENRFPMELLSLIDELNMVIDMGSFALVDDLDQDLSEFGLRVQPHDVRITDLRISGDTIHFSTEYALPRT